MIRLAAAADADADINTDTSNTADGDTGEELVVCSSTLYQWARNKARRIGFGAYLALVEHDVPSILYVYKHYVDGNSGIDEYFGSSGEYTKKLLAQHKETRYFWQQTDSNGNVMDPDNEVVLMGMHGYDLAKTSNLVNTLMFMYPDLGRNNIKKKARSIQNLIESIPDTYDNPMLSLNALAATQDWVNGKDAPDALLIGDGLLEFLNDLKLKDGPNFILTHEWGHHLQFHLEIDLLFNGLGKGAATRRAEMMADAFGAYYLTHRSGGNFDEERVRRLNEIAFSIGDCKDDSEAHHGTPLQRDCAAVFGSKLALQTDTGIGTQDTTEGSGLIHPSVFRKLFDDALPDMLSLDEEVCNFSGGEAGEASFDEASSSISTSFDEAKSSISTPLDEVSRISTNIAAAADDRTLSPTTRPTIHVDAKSRFPSAASTKTPHATFFEPVNNTNITLDRNAGSEETADSAATSAAASNMFHIPSSSVAFVCSSIFVSFIYLS